MATSERKLFAGRYELLEAAGQGGMATVWRAVMHGAAGFALPVAIKRVHRQLLANDELSKMFIEEARVGSQLRHPNIVQILDFGADEDGAHFLVMEWIDGLDFRQYTRALFDEARRAVPWTIAVAIGVEALRALAAAHERVDAQGNPAPVIHRDVTPPNLLIGLNGIVKLTDFGLSRAMDRARMTHPDIVKGNLGYLAPELALGKDATVQSDLFSLGVVLWEALAGRRLYQGKNDVDLFVSARKAEIPSLGELRDDLPPDLVEALDRALSREPYHRFASARQMLRALTDQLKLVRDPVDSPVLAHSVREALQLLQHAAQRRPRPTGPVTPDETDSPLQSPTTALAGPGKPPPPPRRRRRTTDNATNSTGIEKRPSRLQRVLSIARRKSAPKI